MVLSTGNNFAVQNVIINNNVLSRNYANGLDSETGLDVKIFNNTIYGNGGWHPCSIFGAVVSDAGCPDRKQYPGRPVHTELFFPSARPGDEHWNVRVCSDRQSVLAAVNSERSGCGFFAHWPDNGLGSRLNIEPGRVQCLPIQPVEGF